MNSIRQVLEDFLASSTPEQLQAELAKGYRPLLQKLYDPIFLVEEAMFTFPAKVSFFQGHFAEEQSPKVLDTTTPPSGTCAANQELALAA